MREGDHKLQKGDNVTREIFQQLYYYYFTYMCINVFPDFGPKLPKEA
jgi:hypothetical protein